VNFLHGLDCEIDCPDNSLNYQMGKCLVKEVTEDAADFFGDVAADALDDAAPSEMPDGYFVILECLHA
jgi:hypothetical protein